MVEAIAIFGVVAYMAFVVWLVIWIKTKWKKAHAETQYKITDAEIFKMMTKANHFLSEEQLAAVTDLTDKEAKARLMHLAMQGVITRFHDASGMRGSVYQLKEEVPLINSLPAKIHNLSDTDIIDVVLIDRKSVV